MIINVRGTNGSGKTFVVHQLLKAAGSKLIYGELGARLPEAHSFLHPKISKPVFVLGPYSLVGVDLSIGGCDRLSFPAIERLINKYSVLGHVIFEGVLISTFYGVIGKLLEPFGKDAVLMFLDTPVEECVRRVNSRRVDGGAEFDPTLLRQKHTTIAKVRDKVAAEGKLTVLSVKDSEAAEKITRLLSRGPANGN